MRNKGIKIEKGRAIREKEEEEGKEKEGKKKKRERREILTKNNQRDTHTYADERHNEKQRNKDREVG